MASCRCFIRFVSRKVQEWFQTDFVTIDIVKLYRTFLGDRIKGLKLRHFGKLNFTYHGKLQCHSRRAAVDKGKKSLVYCGSCTAAIAALYDLGAYLGGCRSRRATVNERLFPPLCTAARVLRLMYCGSYIFEGSIATVDEPQNTSRSTQGRKKSLVYCGT